MEKSVKNKAYECNGSIIVFTGEIFYEKAEFLEHCYSESGKEIIARKTIPLERISLDGDLIEIKEGEKSIGTFYFQNKDTLFYTKGDFQRRLKQYNEAII